MKNVIIVCLLIAFCLLSFYIFLQNNKINGLEESTYRIVDARMGEFIVNALSKYKNDHQILPDSLEELTPNYLPKIIKPKWGEEWIYYPDEDKQFYELYLDSKFCNDYLTYNSEFDLWLNNPLIDSE